MPKPVTINWIHCLVPFSVFPHQNMRTCCAQILFGKPRHPESLCTFGKSFYGIGTRKERKIRWVYLRVVGWTAAIRSRGVLWFMQRVLIRRMLENTMMIKRHWPPSWEPSQCGQVGQGQPFFDFWFLFVKSYPWHNPIIIFFDFPIAFIAKYEFLDRLLGYSNFGFFFFFWISCLCMAWVG